MTPCFACCIDQGAWSMGSEIFADDVKTKVKGLCYRKSVGDVAVQFP